MQGGDPAKPGRYPYMASLRTPQSRSHFCGAALIARDLLVTAAHCVDRRLAGTVPLPHIKIGGSLLDDDPDAEVGPDYSLCLRKTLAGRFGLVQSGDNLYAWLGRITRLVGPSFIKTSNLSRGPVWHLT